MAVLGLPEGLDLLDRRTRAVRVVLMIYIAASLAEMIAVTGELTGTIDTTAVELDLTGSLGAVVHLLYVLALLASATLVGMWIYRAHANLRAAEIDGLEYSPGWAVGWYFIPFANFIKPFGAMRELWATSLAQADSYGQEADPRLKLWWGFWIVGSILSNIAMRMQGQGTDGGTTTGYVLDIGSTALLMAAAWFLLQIVGEINAAQRSGTTLAQAFA